MINYRENSIYYIDFSNIKKQDEILKIINESTTYIRKQHINSVLVMTNIENMFFNSVIRSEFLDFLKGNKPYIKRSAIIGMSGLQRILVNGLMSVSGRNVRSFDNEISAKEYIIK